MIFKTPLAFAVVSAISASLMALLGGLFGLVIYLGLVQFAVIPPVSHFDLSGLVVLAVVAFVLTLPIETLYARQTLFSKDRSSATKLGFLCFPVLVAVSIWRWARGE
jgi:hypothetical protein